MTWKRGLSITTPTGRQLLALFHPCGVVAENCDCGALVVIMTPPPGQVWSIREKPYNCLAYLFTKGKIPAEMKAAKVREAHTSFAPWRPPAHTPNWRANFNSMKKQWQEGKLTYDENMLTEVDKAELDTKIATIVGRSRPQGAGGAGGAGGGQVVAAVAAGADDDKYTDEDIEGLNQAFGGTFMLCVVVVLLIQRLLGVHRS